MRQVADICQGLCNVKETALYFVCRRLPIKMENEPFRVKHPQMSQGVTSHWIALQSTARRGSFFHVKNVIGSISAAEHYLSGTSCPTSENLDAVSVKHLQQKQASTLRIQQLVPAFFCNILLNHNQILNTVCVRWILLLQISLLWEGSLMP